MSKKFLSVVLALVMVFSFAFSAGATDWSKLPKVTFIFASAQSSMLATSKYLAEEAQRINELTGGRFKIQMQFDSKLGGDTEEIEAIQAGDIGMMLLASSALLAFVPEVAVFDMPMMFDFADEAYMGVPELGKYFEPITMQKGIKTLGVGFSMFRSLSTNTNIQKPEDFKGMKIRTLENKYHMDFWQNLGCEPTPIAFTDLYLSLQQGLVSAQDNSIEPIKAMKFYEVQKYFMDIPAFMNVSFVIASPDKWDALPDEYKELLKEYVKNLMEKGYRMSEEGGKNARAEIGDKMTDLVLTDEIRNAMREAAKSVWQSVRNDIGSELCDAYLSIAGRTE